MAGRWVTAWEFETSTWTDVAVDEPALFTDEEARDVPMEMPNDQPGRRQLVLFRPFLLRCAPGRWQVDVLVDRDSLLEARLRQPGHARRRWNWTAIQDGQTKWPGPFAWGQGDLYGGAISFIRLEQADAFLRDRDVARDALVSGQRLIAPGLPKDGAPFVVEGLGGSAVTIAGLGDVPFAVATVNRGAPGRTEMGWGVISS